MRFALAAVCFALTPLTGCEGGTTVEAPAEAVPAATSSTASASPAAPVVSTPAAPLKADEARDLLDGYDAMLGTYVNAAGGVDYAGIAAEPAALNAFVKSLASPGPAADAPAHERLAYLINAYNALTLHFMVEEGIPESIMDLAGGKPWDVKRWNLGGQTVSLNQIEHEMIRPVFNEPRIHWALVCAAYSCPPLRSEAYRADQLEAQLSSQEAYVLNFEHPRYAVRDGDAVKVSPLFDWYGGDFGDPMAYAAKRLGVEASAITGFLDYDWRLNSQQNVHVGE